MLVTVGDGGATGNQNWWRLSNGTGSVSADSDVEIDNSLVINRVLWHQSDQLRFFRAASGSFALAVTASGVLAGKSVLVAVNDTGDAIDAQWDLDTDSIDAIGSRLGLNTNTAETALFNAVATGDLVNIVISDVPGTGPPAVVHDVAASLTAGAPTITASADKEIPAAIFDTAAVLTAGAPTLSATAEKVAIFDTAAALTAGPPNLVGER